MIDFTKLTLSIIKPDAVINKNSGAINELLEKKGFSIILQEKCHMTFKQAENFYSEHKTKGFFKDLCRFLSSGPIIVQVLTNDSDNPITAYREIMGATNPKQAEKNTLRGLFGISIDYNAVHGSDSAESSEREILCFFTKNQLINALESAEITKQNILVNSTEL